jgi:hypothetical protein
MEYQRSIFESIFSPHFQVDIKIHNKVYHKILRISMIFEDLCRIKSFFSDIQRVEKLKFLARHFRRANFFVLFQKFFSETGCVLTLQFQISEGINFFEIRGAFGRSQWE